MKARTAAMRQVHAQLITAPTAIREGFRDMPRDKRLVVLARIQVPVNLNPVERGVLLVLKTLARRCNELQREHKRLGIGLDQLVTEANPALRAAYGVGPDTAAGQEHHPHRCCEPTRRVAHNHQRLERGIRPNDVLAQTYRDWLAVA